MNNKILNICVVGMGKMGLLHASILNSMPKVKLAVVCESNSLVTRFAKNMFEDVAFVDDIKKLRHFEIDAICVTTPSGSHYPIIKTIYSNSICNNIFVEKPLTTDKNDTDRLVKLAEQTGGTNMVGYMNRFSVPFVKGKELIASGILGEIRSFKAYSFSSDYVNAKENAPRRSGALKDIGSHIIDISAWYFPGIDFKQTRRYNIDEASFVCMDGSITGEYEISWLKKGFRTPEFGIIINGTNGHIKVDSSNVQLILKNSERKTWLRHDLNDNVPFLLGSPEYYREDVHFIESIVNNSDCISTFKTALKTDALITKIEEAGTTL